MSAIGYVPFLGHLCLVVSLSPSLSLFLYLLLMVFTALLLWACLNDYVDWTRCTSVSTLHVTVVTCYAACTLQHKILMHSKNGMKIGDLRALDYNHPSFTLEFNKPESVCAFESLLTCANSVDEHTDEKLTRKRCTNNKNRTPQIKVSGG